MPYNNKEKQKEYIRAYNKQRKRRYKKEIFDILGHKCNNPLCPIPRDLMDERALVIEHVKGHGRKERMLRSNSTAYIYYKRVLDKIRNGSKEYQILCMYCNWLKRFTNKEEN